MKVVCFSLALTVILATAPCRADESLAGGTVVTSSHGQPFCRDRGQLETLLRATISEARYPFGYFSSCVFVPDNARVEVIQDLSPRSRYLHVVRARAYTLLGAVDAYTYSVGLYSGVIGVRFPPPIPSFLPPFGYSDFSLN